MQGVVETEIFPQACVNYFIHHLPQIFHVTNVYNVVWNQSQVYEGVVSDMGVSESLPPHNPFPHRTTESLRNPRSPELRCGAIL